MKVGDMNNQGVNLQSNPSANSKRVPCYLPQEVYEKGEFFVGEEVIRFEKRQEPVKFILMHAQAVEEKVLMKKLGNTKKEMGKIKGKYQILQILSFSFTQEEAKIFLHETSQAFR